MLTHGHKDSHGRREKFRIFRKATVAGHSCILSPATPLSTHCSIEVAHLSPGRCGLVGNSLQNGIMLSSTAREKSVKSVTPLGCPNTTMSTSSLAQDSFPHHACHTSRCSTRFCEMDQPWQSFWNQDILRSVIVESFWRRRHCLHPVENLLVSALEIFEGERKFSFPNQKLGFSFLHFRSSQFKYVNLTD